MLSTKDKLIQVTAGLIRRKGYSGTGISEVLKEVGVPKGSLYHHFPDGKNGLIRQAIQYGGEAQMLKYGEALRGKPALEGLSAMVDVMINDLLESDYKDACPITAVAAVATSMDEDIRLACENIFKGWQENLAGYLERRGVSKANQKAEQLYAMFEGAFVLSQAHKDVKYLKNQKIYIPIILNS
ncbi:TetR/AcrR family transcriptional regulator [Roseivirga seohaensis]|uniref:TetR/AcrR family transcriptional regulator n=1 Tax=Roseivirga seohaensis TaxID=1914963 RepID=UPI003BA8957A